MPLDYKKLTAEVEGGLKNSAKLRDAARKNHDFYAMDFAQWQVKHRDGQYQTDAVERYSPVFRRFCDILGGSLYKQEPRRTLADAVSTELLAKVYKRQRMGAKWKRMDALTFIGGFGAFQFGGGDHVQSPVVITQWQPHELVVWTDPDDSTKTAAVATIQEYDGGARLKLWTPETVAVYERKKGLEHEALGSRAWKRVSKKDNPYRSIVVRDEETGEEEEGVIPFSFAHWNFPCSYFDTNSPGDVVCQFNEHVNRRLTLLGDAIEYQTFPLAYGKNLPAGFKFPAKLKPGQWIEMVDDSDITGNMPGGEMDLGYLAPPLDHIAANWQELHDAIDHMLEMNGIPQSLFRMVQDSAASGTAIQSEQLPLMTWLEGRRGDWSSYEEDAARMAMTIAAHHTRTNGVAVDADRIQAALDEWEFTIKWPSLFTQLPGPQRDQSDQAAIEMGLANKVSVLMARDGLTEDEAIEYLVKLAEQDDKLAAMGIDPKPAVPPPSNPFGPPQPGQPPAQTNPNPQPQPKGPTP